MKSVIILIKGFSKARKVTTKKNILIIFKAFPAGTRRQNDIVWALFERNIEIVNYVTGRKKDADTHVYNFSSGG